MGYLFSEVCRVSSIDKGIEDSVGVGSQTVQGGENASSPND